MCFLPDASADTSHVQNTDVGPGGGAKAIGKRRHTPGSGAEEVTHYVTPSSKLLPCPWSFIGLSS